MTSIFETLRETHPYRLLLIATLALVVLAQGVAMVMLTRSQVQKAQLREAAGAVAPHGRPRRRARRCQAAGACAPGRHHAGRVRGLALSAYHPCVSRCAR